LTDFNDMGVFPAVTVGTGKDYSSLNTALDEIQTYVQGGSILIDPGQYSIGALNIDGAPVSMIGGGAYSTTVNKTAGWNDLSNSALHLEGLKMLAVVLGSMTGSYL
jgi:hypothetical protein